MKNRFFLLLLLIFFQNGFAQTVASIPDKKNILIGEQLHLQLFAEFKNGQHITWFNIDSIPHFEILDKSSIDTLHNENSTTLKQVFTIITWDSGQVKIPSFSLLKSKTDPVFINVTYSPSPLDATQPYHDIKDIVEVQKPTESKWYWYVVFALVVIALFMLFFPKEKKKEKTAFVPDEGAYKAALRKLDQLKQNPTTDHKSFYTELIQIFREYLFKRKNIQSFSKTTDDLAMQIRSLQIPTEEYQQLVQTLRLSDLVKFAQFLPTEQENATAIRTIKESIINIENVETSNLKPQTSNAL